MRTLPCRYVHPLALATSEAGKPPRRQRCARATWPAASWTNRHGTAYHEAGHVVVLLVAAGSGGVSWATIEPEGQSLGRTAGLKHKYTNMFPMFFHLLQAWAGAAAEWHVTPPSRREEFGFARSEYGACGEKTRRWTDAIVPAVAEDIV